MNRRPRKQRLIAEINITPFTYVVLVLLIIFMIATPLIFQSGIKVKLPEARSGRAIESIKQAYITITNEGAVYLDEKPVTKKELKEKVSIMLKNNPDLGVVLRSDKLVKFKDIVDVLDPLVGLGISRVSLATAREQ